MGRVCAECSRDLPQSSYTANQYSKREGISRCAACVHGHHADTPSAKESNSGRYNESSRAMYKNYDLNNPFAAGAFRWVAKGRYVSGPRKDQPCVAKWFKTGAVFSSDYFTLDIKAVGKALELINQFNQLNIINKVIKSNVSEVWRFDDDCPEDWVGQKFLCEPFITNY